MLIKLNHSLCCDVVTMPPKKVASKGKAKPASNGPTAGGAVSTRVETPTGSHVTTVVKSNIASAAEPASGPWDRPVDAETWLARGRAVWADDKAASSPFWAAPFTYGHYKHAFEARGPFGAVRWADIDAEFALSFVFQGSFSPQVRLFPPGTNSSSDEASTPLVPAAVGAPGPKGDDGLVDRSLDEVFFFVGPRPAWAAEGADGATNGAEGAANGVVAEGCFVVQVVEDPAFADQGDGGGIQFVGGGGGEGWRSGEDGGRRGGEGCSCLYGNPCVDQYVCKDWANRMDVARKNGFKG